LAVQAALAQDLAGWRLALKINAWTPYMTVHDHTLSTAVSLVFT